MQAEPNRLMNEEMPLVSEVTQIREILLKYVDFIGKKVLKYIMCGEVLMK